jgi:hypothetical protein
MTRRDTKRCRIAKIVGSVTAKEVISAKAPSTPKVLPSPNSDLI